MAYSSKSSSFQKIILIVFGVAFGLVALALLFQGVKTGNDIRSRAAQTSQIYKQWEFDGADTEGWDGVAPYSGSVSGGIFTLWGPKGSALPAMRNTSVGTALPAGLKSVSLSVAVGPPAVPLPTGGTCGPPPKCNGQLIQLMLSNTNGCPTYRCNFPVPVPPTTGPGGVYYQGVGGGTNFMDAGVSNTGPGSVNGSPPLVKGASTQTDNAAFQQTINVNQACPMDARICPDGTAVGRSGNGCSFVACPVPGKRTFIANFYYKLAGRSTFERPIKFTGPVNGSYQTITVNLPNPESITIESIRIVFTSGVKSGQTIGVDWIRLLGSVPTPSCKPRPACLDATPACLMPITSDMCPPSPPPAACSEVVNALVNVTPLKVASSIALNWGGINEKWFQDKNSAWYYIFPPRDVLVFASQNGISKNQIQPYAVMKWNSTTGLQINGGKTGSDTLVTMATKSCYDAITTSFTFPNPGGGPTACGQNGSLCYMTVCPTCIGGTNCPARPCTKVSGQCNSGTCIPVATPTVPPGCFLATACTNSMPPTCYTSVQCPNGTPAPTGSGCVPPPACLYANPPCKIMIQNGVNYCPSTNGQPGTTTGGSTSGSVPLYTTSAPVQQ